MNNSGVMIESADGQTKTLWPSSSGGNYKYDGNNEEMLALKQKFDDLKEQYQKDKEFYERALETRTEQLEAKEADNEKLAQEREDLERKVVDLEERIQQQEAEHDLFVKEQIAADKAQPHHLQQINNLKIENERLVSEVGDFKMQLDFEKQLNEEKDAQLKELHA
jgi:chromosome segregation ATPase